MSPLALQPSAAALGLNRYLLRIYPSSTLGLEWSHEFSSWDDDEAVAHVRKWVVRDPIVRDGTFSELVLYNNEAPHYQTVAVYQPHTGWVLSSPKPTIKA